MPIFKNISMIRDEKLTEWERVCKKLRTKSSYELYPPIGHVYSVMVEELKITNPDIQFFINQLNQYLRADGSFCEQINNENEYFWPRLAELFRRYLRAEYGWLPEDAHQKLVKEAYGGFIC